MKHNKYQNDPLPTFCYCLFSFKKVFILNWYAEIAVTSKLWKSNGRTLKTLDYMWFTFNYSRLTAVVKWTLKIFAYLHLSFPLYRLHMSETNLVITRNGRVHIKNWINAFSESFSPEVTFAAVDRFLKMTVYIWKKNYLRTKVKKILSFV